MSTLTTGAAGQQQLRSARRDGPDRSSWPSANRSAGLALRCGSPIMTPVLLLVAPPGSCVSPACLVVGYQLVSGRKTPATSP